jgi:hypothetical protein
MPMLAAAFIRGRMMVAVIEFDRTGIDEARSHVPP